MPRARVPGQPLRTGRQVLVRKFGPIGLTRSQVRAMLAMQSAGRGINSCEVPGVNLQSFYRLREFGLAKSKMMAGARFEPRYGLLWWLTPKGSQYLDALIEEYADVPAPARG
jgi:hypothetical protein